MKISFELTIFPSSLLESRQNFCKSVMALRLMHLNGKTKAILKKRHE